MLLVAALLVVSCDDGDRCAVVAPCGGDVVGRWVWVRSCGGTSNAFAAETSCPGAKIDSDAKRTLELDFDRTGRYLVTDGSTAGSFTLTWPLSCFDREGENRVPARTCADLTDVWNVKSCTGTDVCRCVGDVAARSTTSELHYAVSGTQLVITAADGSVSARGFCVAGDRLTVNFPPSLTAPIGTPGESAVYERR